MLYNTTQEVRSLASGIIWIVAAVGPINAFNHTTYFTLRSGGKTWITFLFDSAYLWVIAIPLARILAGGTNWPVLLVYALCQLVDGVKTVLGYILLKKEVWVQNIVEKA